MLTLPRHPGESRPTSEVGCGIIQCERVRVCGCVRTCVLTLEAGEGTLCSSLNLGTCLKFSIIIISFKKLYAPWRKG